MREQNNKTVGLIALLISVVVVIPLGFIWHVLPAAILMTFFGAIIATGTWALFQGFGGYKLHLLICTIVLFFITHYNSKKHENKVHELTKEKNDE